jgi:hypothetical protein
LIWWKPNLFLVVFKVKFPGCRWDIWIKTIRNSYSCSGPAGLRIKPTRIMTKHLLCNCLSVGTALASTWNTELINSVGKP